MKRTRTITVTVVLVLLAWSVAYWAGRELNIHHVPLAVATTLPNDSTIITKPATTKTKPATTAAKGHSAVTRVGKSTTQL